MATSAASSSLKIILFFVVVVLPPPTLAWPASPLATKRKIPSARRDRPLVAVGSARRLVAPVPSRSSPSSLEMLPPDGGGGGGLDASSISVGSSLLLGDAALRGLAEALGYAIGAASLLLYTPIAIRMLRTGRAEGLTASTWWLKLTSYTCTDVYSIKNGFPISTYSETLVITLEAIAILGLVSYYQRRFDRGFLFLASSYLAVTAWLVSPSDTLPWGPPDDLVNVAQVAATLLNMSALLPQLRQNWERGSSGDYSPVTASLAAGGCALRLFTTFQLAGGDGLLLLGYGSGLLLNAALLGQVLYYGTAVEGKSLRAMFLRDVSSDDDGDAAVAYVSVEMEDPSDSMRRGGPAPDGVELGFEDEESAAARRRVSSERAVT